MSVIFLTVFIGCVVIALYWILESLVTTTNTSYVIIWQDKCSRYMVYRQGSYGLRRPIFKAGRPALFDSKEEALKYIEKIKQVQVD